MTRKQRIAAVNRAADTTATIFKCERPPVPYIPHWYATHPANITHFVMQRSAEMN